MKRPTFLTHFALTLALVAGGWFAWMKHVPQTIFANDASMMTSVILGLLVATMVYLGWQAWGVDEVPTYLGLDDYGRRREGAPSADSSWGHTAEDLAVMLGFVGTAIGLSMQAVALAAGSQSFGALATALFTTATGGVAAIAIKLMTHNLDQGIKRASRS